MAIRIRMPRRRPSLLLRSHSRLDACGVKCCSHRSAMAPLELLAPHTPHRYYAHRGLVGAGGVVEQVARSARRG
jgi:hypothetical protein